MEDSEQQYKDPFDTAIPIDQSSQGGLNSLNHLIANIANMPKALKLEFYGEELYQDDEGMIHNIQVSEPIFTMRDKEGEPIMRTQKIMTINYLTIY